MSYRPDIDGLRAFAVLLVLIFHAFPTVLPGGFIGVDIFFVISGYIISSILLNDLEKNQLSILDFYRKRIKRIIPSLMVVLIFCLAVGWIILTAGEYKQLGRYVAGGTAFLNNFLLWKDAGYFDNESSTKILLHLWSLSIEEQFYLVWPLFLVLAYKLPSNFFGNYKIGFFILIIIIISIFHSHVISKQDLVADFYSPLTRFWEILIGAGLAYYERTPLKQLTLYWSNYLSILGLLLLIGIAFYIESTYTFPGLWALLPTVGAALIIASKKSTLVNQRILPNRLMVGLGKISYPLYLWHWPLLTFARIMEGQTPSSLTRFLLLLASFLLAYLTYRWIEKPIRLNNNSTAKNIIFTWLLIIINFILLIIGYLITRNEGLPSRQYAHLNANPNSITLGADRSVLKKHCGINPDFEHKFEWCLSQSKPGPIQFLVLGDSKAEALYYGLARESAANQNWALLGSFPTFKLDPENKNGLLNIALDYVEKTPSIQGVVLVSSFRHLFPTHHINGFIEKEYPDETISKMIEDQNNIVKKLHQMGKQVTLVIDNPTLPDPNSCIDGDMTKIPVINKLLYRNANPHCQISYTQHINGTKYYQEFINKLKVVNPNLLVFNPLPLLCDLNRNICTYKQEGQFLYSYGDHISDYANSKIARHLLPLIKH